MHLWIEVQDDVVVANLSPDDNRSHWRTDSVELAFDPAGPGASAHTLDTVKIGIVPFNTEGRVMAARTADANPGPVARTLPRFRCHSKRTSEGYRIEVEVPLSDLGLVQGRPFGFNLMVYDSDKSDAAEGENANTARTAWSPWPAVQGNPRLWGRVR
ncbi:MAG: sugar-binding protein [Vulcanimicrobiota bacterium]